MFCTKNSPEESRTSDLPNAHLCRCQKLHPFSEDWKKYSTFTYLVTTCVSKVSLTHFDAFGVHFQTPPHYACACAFDPAWVDLHQTPDINKPSCCLVAGCWLGNHTDPGRARRSGLFLNLCWAHAESAGDPAGGGPSIRQPQRPAVHCVCGCMGRACHWRRWGARDGEWKSEWVVVVVGFTMARLV